MPVVVSINLCCYNSEKYLRETLDSVVNQTYKDWELVIINDGSTDSTEAIVKKYIDMGLPIIYHCQENRGLSYSRNVALDLSNGKYIAFLDHDDVWLPEKLKEQVSILDLEPEVDLVYTNYYVTKGKKNAVKYKSKQPEGNVFYHFLNKYPIHISTVLVNRASLRKLNLFFDVNLNLTEDYEFFMRLLYTGNAKYMSKPLATYRYHASMSSVQQEIRLIRETIFVNEKIKLGIEPKHIRKLESVIFKNNSALAFKLSKDELSAGDQVTARNIIESYKYTNIKMFIFYLLMCLPSNLIGKLWASFIAMKRRSLA